MTKLTIKTGSEEEFFKHGSQLARAADRGEKLTAERIMRFEDPEDVIKIIKAGNLALFRAEKEMPSSMLPR